MTIKIYVGDCESTGVTNHPKHNHPQIIEWAHIQVDNNLQKLKTFVEEGIKDVGILPFTKIYSTFGESQRYRPSMEIHKRAREVHGIWMQDLLKCPKSEDLKLPEMSFLVGHNIQYDYRCLGKPEGIKLICTLSLVKQIDKKFGVGFKNHKQDDLLVHFYGERIRPLVTGHHEALVDCVKCILLLVKLLEYVPNIKTFEELYIFQQALKPKKKS